MKFLTTNFVKCAVKACDASDASFPLKYDECELELQEHEYNQEFLISMVDRLDWNALVRVAADLGNTALPVTKPENLVENEQMLKDLHSLLLETQITNGKMTCKNCGHIYYIKDSIANFLLPPHLAN
ncbi:hypothetical protein OGAPHI_002987 [Ogataea philodendri]|uniref:Multifunctional methyltransferase subunit trm112 n=1 Tax=Ogataea philodendri TaxID=1378263 RepID=A0A9P8T5T5_9ASCO|nr:uncharacterized protein OGAPHI_002987 [Ogataea philodendri]KAH3667338.1 hypothetical protein OGAPHI_002987 [Ogataea philodendri]